MWFLAGWNDSIVGDDRTLDVSSGADSRHRPM